LLLAFHIRHSCALICTICQSHLCLGPQVFTHMMFAMCARGGGSMRVHKPVVSCGTMRPSQPPLKSTEGATNFKPRSPKPSVYFSLFNRFDVMGGMCQRGSPSYADNVSSSLPDRMSLVSPRPSHPPLLNFQTHQNPRRSTQSFSLETSSPPHAT
jgi:hypothetical protein